MLQLFLLIGVLLIYGVVSFQHTSAFLSPRLFSIKLSDSQITPPSEPVPSDEPKSKGFGKPAPKKVEEEKDIGTEVYERQAKRGVPEYNIFLRPNNGSETDWVPVGSMTIPRDTPVSKAVFEVESELLKGTFKLYPKLRNYYDSKKRDAGESTSKDSTTLSGNDVFEYGYILKAFPDEEIKVIKRESEGSKNFIANWLGRLTNPIDTSGVQNKGQTTLKTK